MKDKSKRLMSMNVYITNTSPEEVPPNYVHSLYSLRWQIEILFKTWKSFFEIDECKGIKKNVLNAICILTHWHSHLFLYDVSNATVSTQKAEARTSEYKAIYMIKDYFPLLFQAMAVDTDELSAILHRLYQSLKKNGRKCHRYKNDRLRYSWCCL